MGKRQIGEMQPFELVITLIIADLATLPMSDTTIPLVYGVVGIITVFILHQALSFVDRKCAILSNVISGVPTIVINRKGINIDAIKRQNLSVDDLLESIRGEGYSSVEQIAYAIFETNGKLSVIAKKDDELPSHYVENKASLPIVIMEKGKPIKQKLDKMKINQSWLEKQISTADIDMNKVVIAMIDEFGKLFIQTKHDGYKVLMTDYRSGNIW